MLFDRSILRFAHLLTLKDTLCIWSLCWKGNNAVDRNNQKSYKLSVKVCWALVFMSLTTVFSIVGALKHAQVVQVRFDVFIDSLYQNRPLWYYRQCNANTTCTACFVSLCATGTGNGGCNDVLI